MRRMLSLAVAAAFALGLSSAQAYTGQTTNKTYKTATAAAKATAAYYMSKATSKAWHSSQMKVTKEGRTVNNGKTATWRLMTITKTPMGYPTAAVTVKVKKLSDHKWKGYTNGKNTVSFLKALTIH